MFSYAKRFTRGPLVGDAPDIAFLPRDMRYLPLGNADFTSNKFMVDAFGISGCHRMHGVMLASGGPIKKGFDLSLAQIYDMAPTLLYLSGHAVPDDMDGRVLEAMISDSYLNQNPVRFTAEGGDAKVSELTYSSEENEEVLERLKNLGYIG